MAGQGVVLMLLPNSWNEQWYRYIPGPEGTANVRVPLLMLLLVTVPGGASRISNGWMGEVLIRKR